MGIPLWMKNAIYSFHMPFFFVISGLMYSPLKLYNKKVKDSIIHETKKILYPYFVYSVVVLLFMSFYKDNFWIYLKEVLVNGWGFFPLWFVPVFYISRVVFLLVLRLDKPFIFLFILLCALIGTWLSHMNILLPYNISSIPIAIVFIFIGYFLNKIFFKINLYSTNKVWLIIISVLLFLIILWKSQKYHLDMCINHIIPVLPIGALAIIGTLMLILVSLFMSKIYNFPILSLCGKNTFMLMALPIPLMNVIKLIIGEKILGLEILSTCVRWLIFLVIISLFIYLKDHKNTFLSNICINNRK